MDEYNSIKNDILEREDVKRRIRASNAAIGASMIGAGIGAYHKQKAPFYAALGVAGAAGWHKAKNEKHKKELGAKIKGRFGVKEEKLINTKALLPSQEKFSSICKEAITGSLVHMLSDLIPHYHNLPHFIQQVLPAALDIATIPALGLAAKNQLQNVSQLAAKNYLKMPMTSGETIRFGVAKKFKDMHDAAEKMKHPLLGPVARYFGGYAAAPAAGIALGEGMGKGLKFLPQRMRESVVDAVKSEGAQNAILEGANEVKHIAGQVAGVAAAGGAGWLTGKVSPDAKKKNPLSEGSS